MFEDMERATNRAFDKGFGCCLASIFPALFLLITAPISYIFHNMQEPPENALLKNKAKNYWAYYMNGLICGNCQKVNENHHIMCFACGRQLGRVIEKSKFKDEDRLSVGLVWIVWCLIMFYLVRGMTTTLYEPSRQTLFEIFLVMMGVGVVLVLVSVYVFRRNK